MGTTIYDTNMRRTVKCPSFFAPKNIMQKQLIYAFEKHSDKNILIIYKRREKLHDKEK